MVLAGLVDFDFVGGDASDCLLVPSDLPSSSNSFAISFGGIIVSILILTFLFCCRVASSLLFCLNRLLIEVCCCHAILDGREV